jgi:hypothetical protein
LIYEIVGHTFISTSRSAAVPELWTLGRLRTMKKISDKILAKRLLELRERGGYSFPIFVRINSKRYRFWGIYFGVILALLSFFGDWPVFGLVVSFALGMLFCDSNWFRGQKIYWPFNEKVINWDAVKKISDDEPSA